MMAMMIVCVCRKPNKVKTLNEFVKKNIIILLSANSLSTSFFFCCRNFYLFYPVEQKTTMMIISRFDSILRWPFDMTANLHFSHFYLQLPNFLLLPTHNRKNPRFLFSLEMMIRFGSSSSFDRFDREIDGKKRFATSHFSDDDKMMNVLRKWKKMEIFLPPFTIINHHQPSQDCIQS